MSENSCDCHCVPYVAISLLIYYLVRRYMQGAEYKKPTRCDGKIIIVTGSNVGIGKATALELAKRGGTVYMACRSIEKGNEALKEIKEKSLNENVFLRELDLASFESIREFAKKFKSDVGKLDILVNNAGVFMCPKSFTKDGLETQMGVNHFGHFLLTNLLMDLLKKSEAARIINVSSSGHESGKIDKENLNSEKSYSKIGAYNNSKLANVMFTKELAKRLNGTNITSYSLNPGPVQSSVTRHWPKIARYIMNVLIVLFFKTPYQGCQTIIFTALDPELKEESGKYYAECKEKSYSKLADDEEFRTWLWNHSEKVTGLSQKLD